MPGPLALAPREDDNARIAKRLTARKRQDAPERPPPGPPVDPNAAPVPAPVDTPPVYTLPRQRGPSQQR